jgi:hypothetical protein
VSRFSHAEAVREGFWLKKSKAFADCWRTLFTCGLSTRRFCGPQIGLRRGAVVDSSTFPADLATRKPAMVFSQDNLEDYLSELLEAGF